MTDQTPAPDPVRAFLKELAYVAPLTSILVPHGNDGRGFPNLAVYDLRCLAFERNQLRNEIEAWKRRAEGWRERAQAAAARKPLTDERLAEIDDLAGQASRLNWIAADDALEAIQDMRAELDRLRREDAHADEDEPFFEPGHTYRSANGYTRFHCERIIEGMAVGRETALKGHHDYRPANSGLNSWKSVRAEGCWTDTASEAS